VALHPKPPLKPGAPPAPEPAEDKGRHATDELARACGALETEVEELKVKYEMYFLGVERSEPNRTRDELKKKVLRLKERFTRNAGIRFRIQSLHARFISYERLWMRSAREKEEGTYRRDVVRARQRAQGRGPAGEKQAEDKPSEKKMPEKPQRKEKDKEKKKQRRRKHPERLVRTVVATTAKVEEFGWMVSAEAMQRKMYAAKKRAVIGDGGNWIEPLGQMHFPGWLQILDFLHLLVHLYAAARLAFVKNPRAAWNLYEQMLRDAWGGKVQAVIDVLGEQVKRLRDDASAADRCRVVRLALEYVERNRERMDYPRYRRMGLPVSSAPVESLIKQINHRVKGTEQFWISGGLEAVLQVRAAYLSQDGRAEEFHERRPRGQAVGRNRVKLHQPTG